MRTTITLDDDTAALLQRAMRERGQGLKEVVNDALRRSLGVEPSRAEGYRTPVFDLGEPAVPLDRALTLAGELEDEELLRKAALRK